MTNLLQFPRTKAERARYLATRETPKPRDPATPVASTPKPAVHVDAYAKAA